MGMVGTYLSLLAMTAVWVILSAPVFFRLLDLIGGHDYLFEFGHGPIPHWVCVGLYVIILAGMVVVILATEARVMAEGFDRMVRAAQISTARFLGCLVLGPVSLTLGIYTICSFAACAWLLVIGLALLVLC